MKKNKLLLLMFSLMLLIFMGAGCSPDENAKALKDDQGNIVALDNKEKPTLLFFFTGVG